LAAEVNVAREKPRTSDLEFLKSIELNVTLPLVNPGIVPAIGLEASQVTPVGMTYREISDARAVDPTTKHAVARGCCCNGSANAKESRAAEMTSDEKCIMACRKSFGNE